MAIQMNEAHATINAIETNNALQSKPIPKINKTNDITNTTTAIVKVTI